MRAHPPPEPQAATPTPDSVEELVRRGEAFARGGQSVRAEQYFLAAMEQGAPREKVLPILLRSCIETGRLRSALGHVESELRLSPDDLILRQLAASLLVALERPRAAMLHAEDLWRSQRKSPANLLFLGDFYNEVAPVPQRAAWAYQEFLRVAPESPDAPWVRSRLSKLVRSESQSEVGG